MIGAFVNKLHTGTKVVVVTSVIMFVIVVSGLVLFTFQRLGEVESNLEKEAQARLGIIGALHIQSMLTRKDGLDNDPAIVILDKTLERLSKNSKDMNLWLSMGPKVLAYQQKLKRETEPPLDDIDREAIGTKQSISRIDGANYRFTEPVILGEGVADKPKCFTCHGKDMGLVKGDVIGTHSISIPVQKTLSSVYGDLLELILGAMVIILAVGIVSYFFIKKFFGNPITEMTRSMTELAGGNLEISFPGYRRHDEIGDMSHALEVFRTNAVIQKKIETDLRHARDELDNRVKRRTAELESAKNSMEVQLKELNFLKKTIDEHAIVSVTDDKGIITYVNQLFCDISGYSAEELLGHNHNILKSGDHSDAFYSDLWKTISSGRVWQGEIKNINKSATPYWVRATIVPMLGKDGKPERYYAIRTNITDHKNTEIKQESLLLELEAAKNSAESATRMKSEFLAAMSHEIRTPMAGIIGMTDLLIDSDLTPEQLNWITNVKTSGENLLTILNEILDQSKLEAGKLHIDPVDFHIQSFIQDTTDLFAVKIKEKGLKLNVTSSDDLPVSAHADHMRIGQILSNLLSNALKFTEKGEIKVIVGHETVSENEFFLKISVTDSGIGIKQEACEALFTPFIQADSSTSRTYGGTGLGLSISKQLSEMMGGYIGVTSEIGKGSTFTFKVLCKTTDYEVKPPDRRRSLDRWTAAKSLNILIAEDNAVNQQLLNAIFSKLGHHISIVGNGRGAIGMIGRNKFDVVLMDIRMPVMDGLEATRVIRDMAPPENALPVIALTADVATGNIEEYLKSGINEVCVKPIDLPDLLKTIDKVLGQDIHTSIPSAPVIKSATVEKEQKSETEIPDNLSFEQALLRVESIVDQMAGLDKGDTELDLSQGLDQDIFAELIGKYEQQLITRCDELNDLWVAYSTDTNQDDIRTKLKELTHMIKGGGGSFGYHLVTIVATEADDLLAKEGKPDQEELEIFSKYVAVLKLIARKKISGYGGKPGRMLLSVLGLGKQK